MIFPEVNAAPDRTIPFYNTILKWDHYVPEDVVLSKGFFIVPYQPGYGSAWANPECSVGDFSAADEAKRYFVSTCLRNRSLEGSILFLQNAENAVVGSGIAWQDQCGDSIVSSLHRLIIEEGYQGKELGKVLCSAVMNRFYEQDALPVYIHTQPWSWKAIVYCVPMRFKLQKEDTFSHYKNEYAEAVTGLKRLLTETRIAYLLEASA